VLLAVFTLFDAILWSFFNENMRMYTKQIFSGEFSGLLLKPIDTQFLIMTQNNDFDGVFRLTFGFIVLITNLLALGQPTSIFYLLPFTLLFIAGLVFVYCIWFMISTLAFWVDKLDNINEVVPSFRRVWQLPRELYTGVLSTVLTVIFPIGLVTTLPTEWLIGKGSWLISFYFIVAASVMFYASRRFFTYSIKRYSGVAN
jgi:ABC-2 type transport system permease protein